MTGLYRTDTEALDECLRLMFPDLEADDFRTDGGSINMPKVRTLWAERRAANSTAASGVNACHKGKGECTKVLADKRCFGCPANAGVPAAHQTEPKGGA